MVNQQFITREVQSQMERAVLRFNKWLAKQSSFHITERELNVVMINFLKKEIKIYSSYSLREMTPANVSVKTYSLSRCVGIVFSSTKTVLNAVRNSEYNEVILETLQKAEGNINYNSKTLQADFEEKPQQLSNEPVVMIKNYPSLEEEVQKIFNNVKNYKI